MSEKKKKVRVELRKNRTKPPRENDLTRAYQDNTGKIDDAQSGERVRAKGDVSRYRTVVQDAAGPDAGMRSVDAAECVRGRVLRVHGLQSVVEADDGRVFRCAIRRMLKSLATDERSVVTTGDVVWLRPASSGARGQETGDRKPETGEPDTAPIPEAEGVIERVEPRHGVLTRASRRGSTCSSPTSIRWRSSFRSCSPTSSRT